MIEMGGNRRDGECDSDRDRQNAMSNIFMHMNVGSVVMILTIFSNAIHNGFCVAVTSIFNLAMFNRSLDEFAFFLLFLPLFLFLLPSRLILHTFINVIESLPLLTQFTMTIRIEKKLYSFNRHWIFYFACN